MPGHIGDGGVNHVTATLRRWRSRLSTPLFALYLQLCLWRLGARIEFSLFLCRLSRAKSVTESVRVSNEELSLFLCRFKLDCIFASEPMLGSKSVTHLFYFSHVV